VVGDNVLGSGLAFNLEMFVSPGGYIQGEESALLEALEDRRGEPRNKPPFPVAEGLFGKPTVINNVETLAWVPAIVLRGGEWYRAAGVRGATGLRLVSVSGDVNRPGVYEVPFGQTDRLAGRLPREDLELARELAPTMAVTSICGLGQVAANPLLSVLKHFPEEVEKYLNATVGRR